MDQTIRQAEPEDQEALVDCVQGAYSTYIERLGKKDDTSKTAIAGSFCGKGCYECELLDLLLNLPTHQGHPSSKWRENKNGSYTTLMK